MDERCTSGNQVSDIPASKTPSARTPLILPVWLYLGGTLLGLELVVVLGVAVLASSLIARRFRVAPPVLLLSCGVLLGFVPAMRRVRSPVAETEQIAGCRVYWCSRVLRVRAFRTAFASPSLLKYANTSLPAAFHSCIRSAHHVRSVSL